MIDCLKHVYSIGDVKKSLSLVCKELYNMKYMDISDRLSEHIIKNKGYLDNNLYKYMERNLLELQRYNPKFTSSSKKYRTTFTFFIPFKLSLPFYGFTNIQKLVIKRVRLSIDLNHLINLKTLSLISCGINNIDLSNQLNLVNLCLKRNNIEHIDLSHNLKLRNINLSKTDIIHLNISHLKYLEYLNIKNTEDLLLIKYPKQKISIKGCRLNPQIFYIFDIILSSIFPFIVPLCILLHSKYVNKKLKFDLIIHSLCFIYFLFRIKNIEHNMYFISGIIIHSLRNFIGYYLW